MVHKVALTRRNQLDESVFFRPRDSLLTVTIEWGGFSSASGELCSAC